MVQRMLQTSERCMPAVCGMLLCREGEVRMVVATTTQRVLATPHALWQRRCGADMQAASPFQGNGEIEASVTIIVSVCAGASRHRRWQHLCSVPNVVAASCVPHVACLLLLLLLLTASCARVTHGAPSVHGLLVVYSACADGWLCWWLSQFCCPEGRGRHTWRAPVTAPKCSHTVRASCVCNAAL
jgi:hypothetical protein